MSDAGGHPLGMLAGAAIIFFAYIGFDSVSTHAEEARRPHRDLPIGIVSSLLICTLLYIAVAAVLTGMVPYDKINIDAPISDAFAQVGLPWVQLVVALGALAVRGAQPAARRGGAPREGRFALPRSRWHMACS